MSFNRPVKWMVAFNGAPVYRKRVRDRCLNFRCDKLAEDLAVDNKTIEAHNSQLVKSRQQLNGKMQLISAKTKQVMAECVRLQQHMFTRLAACLLSCLHADIRALQEDMLKNNLEMGKQVGCHWSPISGNLVQIKGQKSGRKQLAEYP